MTRQRKPTSRRLPGIVGQVAIVGLLIAMSGSLAPVWSAPVEVDYHKGRSKSLEGSWDITITTTPNPPFAVPFRILRTVTSAGVVDAYAFPPITMTPGALINSAGHGSWEKGSKRNEFNVIVKYYQLDPANFFGVLDSIGTVREEITVAPDGNSYTSTFVTEIALPDGTVVAKNAGETTATRINVRSYFEDGDDDDDDAR